MKAGMTVCVQGRSEFCWREENEWEREDANTGCINDEDCLQSWSLHLLAGEIFERMEKFPLCSEEKQIKTYKQGDSTWKLGINNAWSLTSVN